MYLGRLILIFLLAATTTTLVVGCFGSKKENNSSNQQLAVEEKQPYEKIAAGMEFSKVKELAGEPTDSWEDGDYVVWYYYRFPIQEIAESGSTENLKGGSYTVTFLDGKVEEVDLVESDIKVYDNR